MKLYQGKKLKLSISKGGSGKDLSQYNVFWQLVLIRICIGYKLLVARKKNAL
jgi:hypothetical protein